MELLIMGWHSSPSEDDPELGAEADPEAAQTPNPQQFYANAVGFAGRYYATAYAVVGVLVDAAGGTGKSFEVPNVATLKTYELSRTEGNWQVDATKRDAAYARQMVENGKAPAVIMPASYDGRCESSGWYYVDEDYPDHPIGQLHAWWDIRGRFEYGRGNADSDLGVGYNWDGEGWKISGSVHEGEERGHGYAISGGPYFGRVILSRFYYVKEFINVTCYPPEDSEWSKPYEYGGVRIREVNWLGGAYAGRDVSHVDGPNAYANACQQCAIPLGERGEATKHTGKNQRYGWDVVVFGVTLNAQSGWSEHVNVHWTAGTSTRDGGKQIHWLIGSNGRFVEAMNVYSY